MTMLTDVTRESPRTKTSEVQGVSNWSGSPGPSVTSMLPSVAALRDDMEQMRAAMAAQDAKRDAQADDMEKMRAAMAAQDA